MAVCGCGFLQLIHERGNDRIESQHQRRTSITMKDITDDESLSRDQREKLRKLAATSDKELLEEARQKGVDVSQLAADQKAIIFRKLSSAMATAETGDLCSIP
jgi:rRNA-processing protein FCF1